MERTQFTVDQVNEFTEYASLVRSIRVENTTELAWKLLATPDDDDSDDSDLDEEEPSTTQVIPEQRQRSKSVKSSGPNDDDEDGESEVSCDSDDSADSKFDARWPLGPDEVVVPKWRLRDEILSFARDTVPRDPISEAKAHRVSKRMQEQLENDILQPIPEMIKALLVHVVDLMAVHIPPIADTLQERIRPVRWEHVINVLSGALHGKEQGPLTSEMIKDARTRLEGMYGPPRANLRFMDLPVEPDLRGYAQRLAFPDGIPKHTHAFSTSTDTAEGVLAVPETLVELRRKRKAFLEQIENFESTRKRRRKSEDLESVRAGPGSPAPTPLASEDEEIDELDSDSE